MRGVVGELGTLRPQDVTILDMEASIEHLTRGTVRDVDALLIVTEPYYRAIETAGRMAPLARELGIEHIWFVANKVRSERDETAIREFCERRDLEIIQVIEFDEQITEADHRGQALIDFAPDSPAVASIRQLADTLEERLGAEAAVAD